MAMIDSSEPTPEMMVDHLDGQIQTLLRENERFRTALQRVITLSRAVPRRVGATNDAAVQLTRAEDTALEALNG